MHRLKVTLFILLTFLCTAATAATMENKKNWQEYVSAPAARLFTNGGIGLEYYFLKNNQMSVLFRVVPYQTTRNLAGINHNNSHTTVIGANVYYYFPLWKSACQNKFFLAVAPGWHQFFGKAQTVSRHSSIKYSTGFVLPFLGLQYRPNDHFYFGLETDAFHYHMTEFKGQSSRQIRWSFFNEASANVVMKF